jgi:hypothetical protein
MNPHFVQSKQELVSVLSPVINQTNIELFAVRSKNQKVFNDKLIDRGLEVEGYLPPELKESIQKMISDIESIKKMHKEFSKDPSSRQKLDFDIAIAVHSNLRCNRSISADFEFWRCLNMRYFIENVHWRWVNDPDNIDNIRIHAKAVYLRGFGDRDRRIDVLRYWMIAERLYDQVKKYYYLENLAERARESRGAFQEFINNVIDNNLYSPGEKVLKTMAEIMLIEGRFTKERLVNAFKRYHTFTNRFLIEGNKEIFEKEICI